MRHLLIILIILSNIINIYSQDAKEHIRNGNKLYKDKKYNDAEIAYRKAAEIDPKLYQSIFNLGDALYKQENYENAAAEFINIINKTNDKNIKAKAYHNLGNSLLKSNKIQESIDAYKNALKLNPKDLDTKYNLEYAKRLLVQQQNQKNNNKKQNNEKQKNQQNNQQQNNQQQNNENQQNDKQNQKQQQDKQQQSKISKEDAERILQALNNEENKLNKKLKKQIVGTKRQPVKNW